MKLLTLSLFDILLNFNIDRQNYGFIVGIVFLTYSCNYIIIRVGSLEWIFNMVDSGATQKNILQTIQITFSFLYVKLHRITLSLSLSIISLRF